MKTKRNIATLTSLKILLAVPLAIIMLVVFSLNASGQKTTKEKTESIPPPPPPPPLPPPPPPPGSEKNSEVGVKEGAAYKVVDEMPVFPGGDAALLNFLAENTVYPKEAKEKGIQGKVLTRIMIKEDGTVSDISILKDVNPLLDKEALRVVGTLPKFTPGKLNGENVPVWYVIPIQFSLK